MEGEIIFIGNKAILKYNRKEQVLPPSLGITEEEYEGAWADNIKIVTEGRNERVVSFEIENIVFDMANIQQSNQSVRHEPDNSRPDAFAPYNFVPLNKTVINGEELKPNDYYDPNRNTGYIDIEIKNLTPFFISGGKENFLNINNKPIIPGSSLRGMIKALVEIIASSKFINYDDKVLAHRLMADSNFSQIYKSKISLKEKVGFFIFDKDKKKYFIQEATLGVRPGGRGRTKHEIVEESANSKSFIIYSGWGPDKNSDWRIQYPLIGSPIPVSEIAMEAYKNDVNRNSNIDYMVLVKAKKYESTGVPVFYNDNGTQVISFGHTRNYRLPYKYPISEFVIDKIEHSKKDLDYSESIFGKLDSHSSRIFVEDAKLKDHNTNIEYQLKVLKILSTPKPTSFQIYMQQPFDEKTPKASLYHWETDAMDKINDVEPQIRGYKKYWHRNINEEKTGRNISWFVDEFEIKESHFRTFLAKEKNLNETEIKELIELRLRPHEPILNDKLFFNGDISSIENKVLKKALMDFFFINPTLKITKPQNQLAKVITSKHEFAGRIRFENLTDKELGTLLLAIDLPTDCCHKIGMGKPLGLGTIEIEPTLYLSDRVERYSKLIDNKSWYLPFKEDKSILDFKKAFAGHLLKEMQIEEGKDCVDTLWGIPRLNELKQMLLWDAEKMKSELWLIETRYMPMEGQRDTRYKDRWVLPKASTIKRKY
jgi:hypothetical protein